MNYLNASDYFTDIALCNDPYPFFEEQRKAGPVVFEPHHGVAIVSAFNAAMAIFNDVTNFSACVGSSGPIPPLPFVPEGDDIGDQILAHRDEFHCADLINTFDRPEHERARSLLTRLFTPRRLVENERFIRDLAERLIDQVVAAGSCEVVAQLGNPFAILVIADLLGIPHADRDGFCARLGGVPAPIGEVSEDSHEPFPLAFLHEKFTGYIEERRGQPRGDVLTDLATAKYADGSTPTVVEVVRAAVNLFAAGQETTARLVGTTLRVLAEQTEIQAELRAKPELIANFIEEVLRLDGPIKGTFRLTRRTTKVAGVEIKAGTIVMIAIPSLNRDPARYDRPKEILLNRPKLREHLAFGRGVHTCPGAPLARVEVRVMLERLLARTSHIGLSPKHLDGAGAVRFDYAATYLIRALNSLHLEFE
jgi:cytochrome P450